ncbi:MAG: class I SAM-dependent methyltransferase [SAR324 cluster bacterium]
MWDQRYGTDEFFYGTDPNDFLRENARLIRPGVVARPGGRKPEAQTADVLCLAEGEGRNAVYLAGLGFRVTAVDGSPVGLAKMQRLAQSRGVQVAGIHSDLAGFAIAPLAWDAIVSIWCHIPAPLRARLYRETVAGLRPGGTLILEAYHPRQLEFRTGGPPTADLMVTLDALRPELAGLDLVVAQEIERVVQEGKGHHGRSAVVQVVGRKPG